MCRQVCVDRCVYTGEYVYTCVYVCAHTLEHWACLYRCARLSCSATATGDTVTMIVRLLNHGIYRVKDRRDFFKKAVVSGHSPVTLSLTINETLKWLSSLPILMQESAPYRLSGLVWTLLKTENIENLTPRAVYLKRKGRLTP